MFDTTAIKKLSREEKLRVMEAIWEDLACEGESIESPAWHRVALNRDSTQMIYNYAFNLLNI